MDNKLLIDRYKLALACREKKLGLCLTNRNH